MPLYFPHGHKPNLSVTRFVELRCFDSDTNRIVEVVVWNRCIEDHAIAAGWREPLARYRRAKVLGDVLKRIVSQASETYDARGKPSALALHYGPKRG
jgi:hypothetical protein